MIENRPFIFLGGLFYVHFESISEFDYFYKLFGLICYQIFLNMIHAEFDQQSGLLRTTFSGVVTADEVVEYVIANNRNQSYPQNLKILSDATKAQFVFKAKELVRIKHEIFESVKVFDKVSDAFVTDKPHETALSLVYMELASAPGYHFMVFSTFEAALTWLEEI